MEGASKFLKGVLGDISTRSAYSQLFIGVTSGWYENTQKAFVIKRIPVH